MHVFKHPKFYEEFRQRAKRCQKELKASLEKKSDQVISGASATARVQRAPWSGPKASSFKQQAQRDSSFKRQASSPKQQASSDKPQATSSWIRDPSKSFKHLWSRDSAMINELLGWRTWKAIWCGENLILFPLHTFSSTVKKWPLLLYPNRSGVPDKLRFSSRIHEILGIDFLIFAYNFCSGFKGS